MLLWIGQRSAQFVRQFCRRTAVWKTAARRRRRRRRRRRWRPRSRRTTAAYVPLRREAARARCAPPSHGDSRPSGGAAAPLHAVRRRARPAATPAGATARPTTPCTFTSGRPRCRRSGGPAGSAHSCLIVLPHARPGGAWGRALRASPERADVRLKAVQAALAAAEAAAETEQGRASLAARLPAIRRHLDRYRFLPDSLRSLHMALLTSAAPPPVTLRAAGWYHLAKHRQGRSWSSTSGWRRWRRRQTVRGSEGQLVQPYDGPC